MKRLVLFVEGEGEAEAMPHLVKRLFTDLFAWDALAIDKDPPFRIGHLHKLVKNEYFEWKRKLQACLKRKNVACVLLVLDGDTKSVEGKPFCAAEVARRLAAEATALGAGTTFSVAIVFANQEYESWLIAGISSVAGKKLPDGRAISASAIPPACNLEESPRDAKGWLNKVIEGGYRPSRDQSALTSMIDLEPIRAAGLRSFQRLESALSQLLTAIKSDKHVATPSD